MSCESPNTNCTVTVAVNGNIRETNGGHENFGKKKCFDIQPELETKYKEPKFEIEDQHTPQEGATDHA
jgi:hypothetical protein